MQNRCKDKKKEVHFSLLGRADMPTRPNKKNSKINSCDTIYVHALQLYLP